MSAREEAIEEECKRKRRADEGKRFFACLLSVRAIKRAK
jgi:hypothetical protein